MPACTTVFGGITWVSEAVWSSYDKQIEFFPIHLSVAVLNESAFPLLSIHSGCFSTGLLKIRLSLITYPGKFQD